MKGDLTTLAIVKEWLGIAPATTNQDIFLQRLITAASRFVLTYCARDFASREYTETYDGGGQSFMILRQWPVTSVQSISFAGVEVTQQATGNPRMNGYVLEAIQPVGVPQRLDLYGHFFPYGRGNVVVRYTAGYITEAEPHQIPDSAPYQEQVYSVWLGDVAVSFDGGAALTKVASAPAPGQYAVTEGLYTFNVADAGKTVLITYSAVPQDITQAVTELVGERYKVKDRIGLGSQSVAGRESVTYFSQRDMNATISTTLQAYQRVIPA